MLHCHLAILVKHQTKVGGYHKLKGGHASSIQDEPTHKARGEHKNGKEAAREPEANRQLTSRASPESWEGGGQGVKHGLGVQAGGQGLVLWCEGGQLVSPALGQHTVDEGLELLTLLLVLATVLL